MIIRGKRRTNFTMISNTGLKDKNMSWKAKGLLAYMLSLPDDWQFYESELTNHVTDGKDSTRTALKELEKNGYLVRKQKRANDGKFAQVDWVVYDEPVSDIPEPANPPLLNTNKLNTNKSMSGKPDKKPSSNEMKENASKTIITYLNEKAGKRFSYKSKATQSQINARMNEGRTVDDFKAVIDLKTEQWKDDSKMSNYLRPSTLFAPTNFENYVNEALAAKPKNQPVKREEEQEDFNLNFWEEW